jgi:hypothetical protein
MAGGGAFPYSAIIDSPHIKGNAMKAISAVRSLAPSSTRSLRAMHIVVAGLLLAGSAIATAAEQAQPIPRIVITAKRMTEVEKAQYAEQERRALQAQREQQQQTRSAGAQTPQRSRKVAAPNCSNC